MKTIFTILTLIVTTTAFAGKCKISSFARIGDTSCETHGIGFKVKDEETCKLHAELTRSTQFFGQLTEKDIIFRTKYVYIGEGRKSKGVIRFESSAWQCIF